MTESSGRHEEPTLSIRKEEMDKKCFVVPVRSSDGNKLLTCLENPDTSATSDNYEKYGNFYYLYNPSIENKLTKVEENLIWNPDNNANFC